MERDVQQTKKMPIAKEGVRTITPFENGVIMLTFIHTHIHTYI